MSTIIAGGYSIWSLISIKNMEIDAKFNLLVFVLVFFTFVGIGILNFVQSSYRTNGPLDGLVPPTIELRRELEETYQLYYISTRLYASFVVSSFISLIMGAEFHWPSLFALGGLLVTSIACKVFLHERRSTFRLLAVERGLDAICNFRVEKLLNNR